MYIRILVKWLADHRWWLESAPIRTHMVVLFSVIATLLLLCLFLPELSGVLVTIFAVGYMISFRVLIVVLASVGTAKETNKIFQRSTYKFPHPEVRALATLEG